MRISDWSSDVCSSDPSPPAWNDLPSVAGPAARPGSSAHIALSGSLSSSSAAAFRQMLKASERQPKLHFDFAKLEGVDAEGCQLQIGRASGRERVCQDV